MRREATVCALVTALAGGMLASVPLAATEKIAEMEELECSSCHTSRRAKKLNDLGMYYELTRTVEGYAELSERFARCRTCHRGQPGSRDLTVTGRRYRWFFEDMDGIREWVMSRHPETNSPAAGSVSQRREESECPK